MERKNLAASAAHWSATHRKTAIFGWLAFVVLAVFIGNAIGQNKIQGADQFSGKSPPPEQALYSHGLRPNDEHVLIQSKTLTINDLEFRNTIHELAVKLSGAQYVVNVKTPFTGGGLVSQDGHSALVDFEITGDSLQAADRLGPSKAAIQSVQDENPNLPLQQFATASSNQELEDTLCRDRLHPSQEALSLTPL